MKHIQYTYITDPISNGPVFPPVAGLQFVWARESEYPTNTPSFFGTCDDDADLTQPGVIREWLQADWEQAQADEMERRNPVPQSVTMRQARLALLQAGLLSSVDAAIDGLPEPDRSAAKIEWEYAAVVQRASGLVPAMGAALGMTEAQIDDLFILAATL
jgi:hypothetical protein